MHEKVANLIGAVAVAVTITVAVYWVEDLYFNLPGDFILLQFLFFQGGVHFKRFAKQLHLGPSYVLVQSQLTRVNTASGVGGPAMQFVFCEPCSYK